MNSPSQRTASQRQLAPNHIGPSHPLCRPPAGCEQTRHHGKLGIRRTNQPCGQRLHGVQSRHRLSGDAGQPGHRCRDQGHRIVQRTPVEPPVAGRDLGASPQANSERLRKRTLAKANGNGCRATAPYPTQPSPHSSRRTIAAHVVDRTGAKQPKALSTATAELASG